MNDDGQGDVAGPGDSPGPCDSPRPGAAVPADVPLTPGWAVPGVGRPSPLLDALAEIRSGLEAARVASSVLSDADCRDGVREFDHVMSEVESFWLELVADLDRRPAAIPGVRAGTTAVAFLTAGLNRTALQARKDVAAANGRSQPLLFGNGPLQAGHAVLQVAHGSMVPGSADTG